jgi:hypothetical protein
VPALVLREAEWLGVTDTLAAASRVPDGLKTERAFAGAAAGRCEAFYRHGGRDIAGLIE